MLLLIPAAVYIGIGLAMMVFLVRHQIMGLYNQSEHRVEVIGEAPDVPPGPEQVRELSYFDQLVALGFEPLGVIREVLPGHPVEAERILFHPQLQCRAGIYCMPRSADPLVYLKCNFADGRYVATFNYGFTDMEATTPHLIDRRVPTHSMQKLLDAHLHSRFEWMQQGGRLLNVRSIDDAARHEEANFRNATTWARFRRDNLQIVGGSAALELAVAAGIASTVPMDSLTAFGMALIAIAVWDAIWTEIRYQQLLKEMTRGQDEADTAWQESAARAGSLAGG